ncbi:MAG: hypothetical protein JRI68_27435 [Deltaproteobacteria bacterium]|nr:hypothetical protein [Deltaproteobacteria bacterium]
MVGVIIVCALAGTLLVLVNEIRRHLPADSALRRGARRGWSWLRLGLRGRAVHAPTWCTPGRVDAACDLSADMGYRTGRRGAAQREPVSRGTAAASWPDLDVPAPAPSHP